MTRETPVPEATTEQEAPRYSRILLGTDGSPCSLRAARHAVYLSEALGAELFALNAVDVANAFHVGIHFGDAVAELERAGKEALRVVGKIAAAKGVRCEEMLVRGRPHAAIIRTAEEVGAGIVILGSTGATSVERVLLGSEAEKVLHYAKIPVLLVRDP